MQEVCDEAIQEIQDVLQRVANVCDSAISRYKSYRNTACFIHCLPVEILQTVFEFAGHCGLERGTNLALTSVCSYWRSVALNDPCMWSCIDEATSPSNYTQLCMQRNKAMPLHVTRLWPEWAKGYSSPHWLLDFTSNNLPRIRTLHVKVGAEENDRPHAVTRYCAPLLEELVLHVEHRGAVYSSVLGDHAPNLRVLELYNCRWPWRPSTYRNLTRLKITLPCALAPTPLNEDITVICRESPALEDLCLCIDEEKPSSTAPLPQSGEERTVMRNLCRLTLHLPIDLAISLLSSIALTSTTTDIDIVARADDVDAPGTLFSAQCLPSMLFAGLRQLELKSIDHRCEFRGDGAFVSSGVPYKMAVVWQTTTHIARTWASVGAAVVRDHSLSAVERLTITEDGNGLCIAQNAPLVAQQPILLHLPAITSLTINYWSARGAARFFRSLHSFLSQGSPRPLPTVSSFTLAIRDCFGKYSHDLLSTLQDFSRLQTIQIRDSRLTIGAMDDAKEFITRLRQLDVPDVRWSRSYMYAWGEGNSQRLVYPRSLWPEDIEYDWKCEEEASHTISSVNAFGQTWCCGYVCPR